MIAENPPLVYAKQSIVVRKDLHMPVGKIAAQVAHASMAVITNQMQLMHGDTEQLRSIMLHYDNKHDAAMIDWLDDSFTKVVLGIDTEDELLALYDKAVAAGIPCSKIIDNGRTVFKDIKTLTCCAFGPIYSDELQTLTGHLKLLNK